MAEQQGDNKDTESYGIEQWFVRHGKGRMRRKEELEG
jgi:hypothetical protein